MKLLRTKIWNWWDVVILKWCCLFYGIVIGAYWRDFVMQYVWILLIVAVLLTIRPAIAYWKD